MSRPQSKVTRPGRPGAAGVQDGPSNANAQKERIEKLRSLPAVVEDGEKANLDPSNVSSGKVLNERCTIVTSRFVFCDWKKKDGTYATREDGTPYQPQIQLELGLKRPGQSDEDKPYRHQAQFTSNITAFGVSKDGNDIMVRPGIKKEGGYVPKFRTGDEGFALWRSFEAAGLPKDALTKKGAAALVGLVADFRSRDVEVQGRSGPRSYPMLLVDRVEGLTSPKGGGGETAKAPAAPSAPAPVAKTQEAPAVPAVPAAAATDTSAIDALAKEALLDAIKVAGGEIEKDKISAKLINIDKWKTHAQRGPILQAIRTGNIIVNAEASGAIAIDGNKLIAL